MILHACGSTVRRARVLKLTVWGRRKWDRGPGLDALLQWMTAFQPRYAVRSIDDWRKLLEGIDVQCDGQPLPKPTPEMVDVIAQEASIPIPEGYRRFIQVFGPGELGGAFFIRAAGYGASLAPDVAAVDIKPFNEEIQWGTGEDGWSGYTDAERARRLVFFASSGGGDLIGWDPKDIRDQETQECGIHVIFHGDDHTTPLSNSYDDFVDQVWLGERWFQLTRLQPSRVFRPLREVGNSERRATSVRDR